MDPPPSNVRMCKQGVERLRVKQFSCKRFLFGLKITVFGPGKQIIPKKSILFIVSRACANNRFPSQLSLIVSLVNILNSFNVRGFCLGLKLPYSCQEKKTPKTSILFIVSRACATNRFHSLLLLIVSLVNILTSFYVRGFCLGLK